MTPRATVRLQLTRDFGFDAATACIDYYAALGISHYYLSPIFRAREGSTHGYDTIDFHRVSDELGGADGLARLAQALRARGMGIIADIVPNHMGVASADNAWWNDVLANGANSRYAGYFDIDWTPDQGALRGKVLLPFLDRPYAQALDAAQIRLDADGGNWRVAHHASRWPLSDESRAELSSADPRAFDPGDADGRARLHALLERQHYRLDEWRAAADSINWRRFFDIAELAALCVEDEAVFADVHKEIFTLFQNGTIDGVRVDHVDGLAYPLEYCLHLRDELETRRPSRPQGLPDAPAYIVVEKVFAAHEPQRDWGVAGTTGYDFMDQAGAVLHNPAGQSALDVLWRRVSGRPWEFRTALTEARRRVLGESFGADLERVARSFDALARRVPDYAHLTPAAIKRALRELIIAFPVYRCYGMPGLLPPEDAAILASALERTYRELNAEDYAALDFIAQCLRDTPQSDAIALAAQAAIRFQQLTTPIAAKAIEDTVFYREARLLSRNEVGSDPNVFSLSADDFHAACSARAQRFPHSLLATATHDHKRGEDVRARLAVLSDDADRWAETVARWSERNAPHRGSSAGMPAPDGVDELMLYQTLVGAWPLLGMDDAGARAHFQQRVAQWWTKALREAKRHTSWVAQNVAYEQACLAFLAALFDAQGEFLVELGGYVEVIAAAGALNGLTQTALRLTTPGVPDLYQGCEFWDFSLVDPDNRRAFDYTPRRAALARHASLHEALQNWRDGVVKQTLIARLLAHRAAWPAFYVGATYQSLPVRGTRAAHVIAFERSTAHGRLICITTRWALSLAGGALAQPRIPAAAWLDTVVELPPDLAPLRDVLHGSTTRTCHGSVAISELLQDFPLAVYFAPAQ